MALKLELGVSEGQIFVQINVFKNSAQLALAEYVRKFDEERNKYIKFCRVAEMSRLNEQHKEVNELAKDRPNHIPNLEEKTFGERVLERCAGRGFCLEPSAIEDDMVQWNFHDDSLDSNINIECKIHRRHDTFQIEIVDEFPCRIDIRDINLACHFVSQQMLCRLPEGGSYERRRNFIRRR